MYNQSRHTVFYNIKQKFSEVIQKLLSGTLHNSDKDHTLIQELKKDFSSIKTLLLSSKYASTIHKCLDKLRLEEDLVSLMRMMTDKQNGTDLDIYKELQEMMYKLTFLETMHEFTTLSHGNLFYTHLSNIVNLLSPEALNHFVDYLSGNKSLTHLNTVKYPGLQNTACMKLIQMIKPPSTATYYPSQSRSAFFTQEPATHENLDLPLQSLKKN